MKSLGRIVVVVVSLLAWRAECQPQNEGGSGLYVTPAYNGDFAGPYVSPAFSEGSFESAPGTGLAPGFGRGERGRYSYGSSSGFGNVGAYMTPAFSGPTLGLTVTSPPTTKAKPKANAENSKTNAPGGNTPGKSSGVSEQPPEAGGTSTNRLENPPVPSSPGTNAPAGQGGNGPL